MRKRLLILLSVLGLGAAVLAITAIAFQGTQVEAFGDGVISTGPNRDGIYHFFVRSSQSSRSQVSGAMRFVEVSPDRQLNVVELPAVQEGEFSGNTVVFAGPGTLNGEPVWIVVQVEDMRGPARPGPRDKFGIACFSQGRLVYGDPIKKPTKTGHVTLLH